jgi:cell division protein FtsW
MDRILNHGQRWEDANRDDVGYQTVQSETAMANAGPFGTGIGVGRAKHMLPAATTDFVLATVAEETGLIGSLVILALLAALAWRLLQLAHRTRGSYGKLVLLGIALWIGVQSSINVMMANGTLPAIGIPLPFISSGGSSLLALMAAMGIAQSVVAHPIQDKAVVEAGEDETYRDRRRHGRARFSRA